MAERHAARVFRDRRAAGMALAALTRRLAPERPVVLALPRGGVPVAAEVARDLGARLDVLLVRKVGAPGNPELGIGAVAEGGVRVLDAATIRELDVSARELQAAIGRAHAELEAQSARYRGGGAPPDVAGRTVLIVDDGLATGGTAAAAVRAVRERGAARVVVAVPVAAAESAAHLRGVADEVICAAEPVPFGAVGAWYEDFRETTDDDVAELLARSAPG